MSPSRGRGLPPWAIEKEECTLHILDIQDVRCGCLPLRMSCEQNVRTRCLVVVFLGYLTFAGNGGPFIGTVVYRSERCPKTTNSPKSSPRSLSVGLTLDARFLDTKTRSMKMLSPCDEGTARLCGAEVPSCGCEGDVLNG